MDWEMLQWVRLFLLKKIQDQISQCVSVNAIAPEERWEVETGG